MKRSVFLMILISIQIMVIFAGGRNDSRETFLSGPASLVLWTHEDPNRSVLEKKFIAEFNAQYPNVSVDYQQYPSGQMRELLTAAFSANQGPNIFNQSQSVIRQFVVEGRTTALDPSWVGERRITDVINRYIPGALEAVELDGNIFGLPLEYTNHCMFVNKQIFREAGLNPETDYPKTWDDLMSLSEKIVQRNGEIVTRRGFDFRYPEYTSTFLPMVVQLGGQLVSDDGKKAVVGDEAWIQFFEYMRQWGPRGKNLGGPTYVAARTAFDLNNNQVAMSLSGLYQMARMKTANLPFYNSGDWMIVPFPQSRNGKNVVTSYIACHYYLVNVQATGEQKIWSWRFIDYMLSHGEDYLREVNLVQPTHKLFNSDFFKALPYSDVFAKDLENGKLVYYAENSSAINDRMRAAVEAAMLLGEDPRSVLNSFRRDVQELLDQQR